jgi:hypothetical protein
MFRRVVARSVLIAALGAISVFLPSAAAQAAGTAIRIVPSDIIGWRETPYTFPDSPAGLAACDAQGQADLSEFVNNYACYLGDQTTDVYTLWLHVHIIT